MLPSSGGMRPFRRRVDAHRVATSPQGSGKQSFPYMYGFSRKAAVCVVVVESTERRAPLYTRTLYYFN